MYLKEYLRLRQKNPAHDKMKYYFEEVILAGSITNNYARESGLPVWICKKPRNEFAQFYQKKLEE